MISHNGLDLPGIEFCKFKGKTDYGSIASVITASSHADQEERTVSAENIAEVFQNYLLNCDPAEDMIIAEVDGEMVGYGRGWWEEEPPRTILYKHSYFLKEEWRGKGVEQALLRWVENRLVEISTSHADERDKFLQVSISHHQAWLENVLLDRGYQPDQSFYLMVRPDLEDLPAFPLPDGVETRPVEVNQYRVIWNLTQETGQGSLEPCEDEAETFQEWQNHPHFQPHLWQIAWDKEKDLPIGHVLTYIEHEENQQYNRKRGYTEGIGVVPDWRRRGIAHALISLSLHAQKEAGMEESALVADSESEFNVTQL